MGSFSDFANEKSKYLRIEAGESVEVVWTGNYIKAKNSFGTEGIEFEFDTDFGKKTFFISTLGAIAQFDNYGAGEKLTIKRNIKGVKPALAVFKTGESAPF
jgi:hypothetical protein